MKNLEPVNKQALRVSGMLPDVFAHSPIPKPDCSSTFSPGIEVASATSSTDQTASTQGLCSPFFKDTMLCSCYYWPAHDPDLTVKETGELWSHEIGHGPAGHEQKWQDLRFVYYKDWQGVNPGHEGVDSWNRAAASEKTDLYIKDNASDTGVEPSSGYPWESPDVFVRNNDDPPSSFIIPGPSDHQNPLANQKNFLYARIHNISKGHSIDHALVRFFIHGMTTNPTGWVLAAHAMLREIPVGDAVVKSIKPWIPPKSGPCCMMVMIDSTQDPVKLLNTGSNFADYDEKIGPWPNPVPSGSNWQITADTIHKDNNIAQRNMTAVAALAGGAPMQFHFDIRAILPRIPRPEPNPDWYTVTVQRNTLPDDARVTLNLREDRMAEASYPVRYRMANVIERIFQGVLPVLKVFSPRLANLENRIMRKIPLRPGTVIDASLTLEVPSSVESGGIHHLVVSQALDGKVLGGITFVIRPVALSITRFVGDVETREVHLSICPAIRELPIGRKRAFFSTNDARSWDFRVHEECLRGYE